MDHRSSCLITPRRTASATTTQAATINVTVAPNDEKLERAPSRDVFFFLFFIELLNVIYKQIGYANVQLRDQHHVRSFLVLSLCNSVFSRSLSFTCLIFLINCSLSLRLAASLLCQFFMIFRVRDMITGIFIGTLL
jgi:hypothetical protein